jgi:hypothetical protein
LQEHINFAKIAEQTERYDDMVSFMREAIMIVLNNKSEVRKINDEEIKLFSNAYKCKISSRRTAWRALSALQIK